MLLIRYESPSFSKSSFRKNVKMANITGSLIRPSLRGRRLKGKGKGVLGARKRERRAPRVSLAPKTPFPFPFKRLPRRLRPSTTKARRSENFYDCFNLIVFQIGHVSLTSADTYRRDSYCLARVFQNLPAPPKQYGVFDVFCDFQSFFPT